MGSVSSSLCRNCFVRALSFMFPSLSASMNWNSSRNAIISLTFGSFIPIFSVISFGAWYLPFLRASRILSMACLSMTVSSAVEFRSCR